MATRTQTETKREITRRGDIVIVKETEITTVYAPGKEPEVKEITRVEEFKGEEGYKRLPQDIRRQLEQPENKNSVTPINKQATKGKFVEESLDEHNRYRKIHGVEPLKLSKELMEVSKKRAEELAAKDQISTQSDHLYGENLSCLWSSDPENTVEASEIISRWYLEGKNYNFNEEPKDLNAGHFTQMIWQSSKEFGIAAAKSNSNRIYVVASYSPPGNYAGEFRSNVHPIGFKEPSLTQASRQTINSKHTFFPEESKKAGPSRNGTDLNDECVRVHNEYRARHGVPPLVYSKRVADYAQEWADHLAKRDEFMHRTSGQYGENLYCFKSSDPNAVVTAADACRSWYDEIKQYNFKTEPKSLSTGHFTQMIWKTTAEVGMGRAKSKTGLQIIVANYNPPGNYVGTFRENVPPPTK